MGGPLTHEQDALFAALLAELNSSPTNAVARARRQLVKANCAVSDILCTRTILSKTWYGTLPTKVRVRMAQIEMLRKANSTTLKDSDSEHQLKETIFQCHVVVSKLIGAI